MNENEKVKVNSYFESRQVNAEYYHDIHLPSYFIDQLPANKDSRILDIGCGLGQTLSKIHEYGYTSLTGIDISNEAIASCKAKNLDVFKINDITEFNYEGEKYDFAIMSHVLEHLDKNKVIETLQHIKTNILKESGQLFLAVPNAQSPTGTYWAYEDFTHNTLFTAGSLIYVLKSAGFQNVTFIDEGGYYGSKGLKKIIKKTLLRLFMASQKFKLFIVGASYHKPSPVIYTWDLKVLTS